MLQLNKNLIFKGAKLLFKVCIAFACLGIGALGLSIGMEKYKKHKDEERRINLFENMTMRQNFFNNAYRCFVSLATKYGHDEQLKYEFLLYKDNSTEIVNTNGSVTIEFQDKDGFLVTKEQLFDFTNVRDKQDRLVGFRSSGDWYIPVDQYIEIKDISVSHNLGIEPSIMPISKIILKEDGWEAKASRIKIGMTYHEWFRWQGNQEQ